MSVGLELVICAEPAQFDDPGSRLVALAEAVGATPFTGAWQGLKVNDGDHTYRTNGPLTIAELRELARRHDGAGFHLVAANSLSCMDTSVHFAVSTWGSEYRQMPNLDWWYHGDSQVWIKHVTPFCPRSDPSAAVNVERLLLLIERIATHVHPVSMKLHSESIDPQAPFNAYLAYARDLSGFLRDADLIRQYWPDSSRPDVSDVEDLLTSATPRCRYRQLGSGHLILGSESAVDATLNDFYRALLTRHPDNAPRSDNF